MIARFLSTGGRGAVVGLVAAVELALGWLLALAATASVGRTLALHPLGAYALRAQGGRLLSDLVTMHAYAVAPSIALVGVAVFLHAAGWMLLGGMFPVLGAASGVRWHRAAAESLRRAPTLLGLAAIAGLGYLLVGFAAFVADGWATRTAATRFDVRVVTLLGVSAWALAAGLAWLIGLWHDVARAHAMARGRGAMQASGASASQILREPIATTAAGAGYALLGAAYVGAAALLAGVVDGSGARPGMLAALLLAQHLVVLGRVHARMKWFIWLGARTAAGR